MTAQSFFDLGIKFSNKPLKPTKCEELDLNKRRTKNKEKQIFSLKKDELRYCNQKISTELIEENRAILNSHIIPELTNRKCLEAAIFCLASQALVFERASAFSNEIVKISDVQINDNEFVYNLARKYLRFPEDRFSYFYEYANKYPKGIEALASDLLSNPKEVREEMKNNIKFMGLKTTSFWYLCMGGKELMTLDVHNLRQISNLKIVPIKESHYIGKRRENGKCIATGPSDNEYLNIEKKVQEYFKEHMFNNAFLFENANLNSAFLTSLFWWEGVKIERGLNPYQTSFFNKDINLGKILPYHLNE